MEQTTTIDDLDLNFKKILCVIRQHIPRINSNAYLIQCRVWLEKLSDRNVNKELRNLYLAELCNQIQANKLLPPFNQAPPVGDLREIMILNETFDLESSQNRKYGKNILSAGPQTMSNNANRENRSRTESVINLNTGARPKQSQNRRMPKRKISKSLNQTEVENMSCGEPLNNQTEEPSTNVKEIGLDDDSWSDLTDTSSGTGIKVFRDENATRNNLGEVSLLPDDEKKEFEDDNVCPILSGMQLETGFKLLKDTNYISQDWKKTIAGLQLRLSEMIQQNTELNAMIQRMEIELNNDKIRNRSLEIAANLHSQEIAKLKEIHAENILQLKKSFQAKVASLDRGYEEDLKQIAKSSEEQILQLKQQNEELINKKEKDICRLSEIIHDQCLRIMNEISTLKNQVSNCTCDKKVHVLKKCVSKMEKLFQNSEKEYVKQIEQLKQELELKENALQIQLKIQKAELIAQTRTGQKEEFEEILNSLEVKYIKMLEGHEKQIMRVKKQDDEKIQHLIELLEKNGIAYNDNNEYSYS